MIRIDNLEKSYGGRRSGVNALRGVTLRIEPGVTAVVGPNGAGKTTLLGLLLGFLHPTGGSVRIDGERPRRYLRRRGAAYLPERFRLPPEWPVRAALRSFARLEGEAGAAGDRRADAALDRLGLAGHADRAIGTLSRGLNQRLGLAQALLADRDLVVLDEPTEGLDPLWRIRFREIVREMDREGRTVVVASHELAEVERVASRAVLLDAGEVRDVMELGTAAPGPTRFRLRVEGPAAALREAFPDARVEDPQRPSPGSAEGVGAPGKAGAAGEAGAGEVGAAEVGAAGEVGEGRAPRTVSVTVADPAELSQRLAAFLAGGGIVRAVVPEGDLEERVRRRLEEP